MIYEPLFNILAIYAVYIAGIIILAYSIYYLITKRNQKYLYIIGIIIGIIYLIIGYTQKDPITLGVLIGVWLLIVGISHFLKK